MWPYFRHSYLVWLNQVLTKESDIKYQVAEIGVSTGENAVQMLEACNRIYLHLIDNYGFLNNEIEVFRKRIEPYAERTTFVQKKSIDAANDYPLSYFDFIYIDAAHDYVSVLEDLIAWYPRLKVGGILGGHDWDLPDVRKAVTHFAKMNDRVLYAVERFSNSNALISEPALHKQGADWWFEK